MAKRESEVREISRDELVRKRREGVPFVLVDVLSHDHFLHVHLPGAINIPLNMLRDLAPILFGPQDEIIVYCASFECQASPTAAKILMQMGFTNVLDYKGGIKDWLEGELPIVHIPHPPAQDSAA